MKKMESWFQSDANEYDDNDDDEKDNHNDDDEKDNHNDDDTIFLSPAF